MNTTRGLLALVLICACLGSGIVTFASAADDPWVGDIVIKSDGSVTPSDAPMKISGKNYKMTSDIEGTITIEKDDVTLNGNGYSLFGDGTGDGVTTDGLEGITVRNMKIEHFTTGIVFSDMDDSKIMNNEIANVRNAISVEDFNDGMIVENSIYNVRYGIVTYLCNDNKITSNTIQGKNPDYFSYVMAGIVLDESCDNKVNDNYIAGFYHDSELGEWNSMGIVVQYYSVDNWIIENQIEECYYGVCCAVESNNNIVKGNSIVNGGFGFGGLYDCNYNTVSENYISGCIGGVYLYYCYENVLKGNYFEDNYDCINIHISDSNILKENVIDGGMHAFWFEESYDNEVYHNDIIDYVYAFDTTEYFGHPTSEADNVWDNGKGEGNYWSDYEGSDTDDDGVGDTDLPYAGVDYYPLMEEYN